MRVAVVLIVHRHDKGRGARDSPPPPAVRVLLDGANFVSLATLMNDGSPHSTVVWAASEGGRPCFVTQPRASSRKASSGRHRYRPLCPTSRTATRTFRLSEAAEAHAYIESRRAFGRVVLAP